MHTVSHLARLGLALLTLCGACSKRHGRHNQVDGGGMSDAPPETERNLAMSQTHNCALREAGLYCWGENFAGQLGTGSVSELETAPVQASVAGSDIVDVVAVTGRTCVRRGNGEIACWGSNQHGQFGDGTREDALVARTTQDIDDAVQLALDDDATCALRADGRVFCWGASPKWAPEQGSLVPKPIAGLEHTEQIVGGVLGTFCARDEGGEVRCFALDEEGVFGAPKEVAALKGAEQLIVTASNVPCALMPSSEIVCANLDNGAVNTLDDSKGTVRLVGTELVACGQSDTKRWRCWNVLAPMLESVGSPALMLPVDLPLIELLPAGLRVCGVREDHEVVCVDAANWILTPEVVKGLPR